MQTLHRVDQCHQCWHRHHRHHHRSIRSQLDCQKNTACTAGGSSASGIGLFGYTSSGDRVSPPVVYQQGSHS